jgi:hypothetical protein
MAKYYVVACMSVMLCHLGTAQVPAGRVQITRSPDAHPGAFVVSIKNEYSSPVSAYTIVYTFVDKKGRSRESSYSADTALNARDAPTGQPVLPGQTRGLFAVGASATVRLGGAVFEDGSAEGEAIWIERIVAKRRRVREDIVKTLAKMRLALENDGDVSRVIGDSRASADRDLAKTSDPIEQAAILAVPDVVETVLKTARVGSTGEPPPPRDALRVLIGQLSKILDHLDGVSAVHGY